MGWCFLYGCMHACILSLIYGCMQKTTCMALFPKKDTCMALFSKKKIVHATSQNMSSASATAVFILVLLDSRQGVSPYTYTSRTPSFIIASCMHPKKNCLGAHPYMNRHVYLWTSWAPVSWTSQAAHPHVSLRSLHWQLSKARGTTVSSLHGSPARINSLVCVWHLALQPLVIEYGAHTCTRIYRKLASCILLRARYEHIFGMYFFSLFLYLFTYNTTI